MTGARLLSRRRILSSLLATPAFAAFGCGESAKPSNAGPPVIVLGAGLAGLNAALTLTDSGRDVVVLEARNRVGGRVHTVRLSDGSPVEAGGEFIDANHRRLRDLVRRFKLKLTEVQGDDSLDDVVLFEGELYSGNEFVTATVERHLDVFAAEIEELAEDIDPDHPLRHKRAAEFESRSVASFLDGLRLDPRARFLIDAGIRGEFTVEGDQLSLLALLQGAALYADVDDDDIERWRIAGGNAQLPAAMERTLGERVRLNTACTALRVHGDTVEAVTGAGTITGSAAIVALPSAVLSILKVEGASTKLAEVLASLPQMGDVLKVIAEFDRPSWFENGQSGDSISDVGATWAPTRRALTLYVGGAATGPLRQREGSHVQIARDHVRRVFDAVPSNTPMLFDWGSDAWTRGGYTAFAPLGMSSWEGLRELHGRVALAGEYTDTFWGYMEGALRSGERAAKQILKAGF